MKPPKRSAWLILAFVLSSFAFAPAWSQIPGPGPGPQRPGDNPFPFPFPFGPDDPFARLLAGLKTGKPEPAAAEQVAQVRYLQSRGLPPFLYVVDPNSTGGAVSRAELYTLFPSSPTAVGSRLYELLKGTPDAEVAAMTKKKLYVLLALLREVAAAEDNPASKAYPEKLEALRKRVAAVMAMQIPDDKEFAGLGVDPQALYEKIHERRQTLDAAIKRIENAPAPTPAIKAEQAQQLKVLRDMYGQLGTLEFDQATGKPLVPTALVSMVKAIPEAELSQRQWEVVFRSFPMGSSLWELRADKLWRRNVTGRGVTVAVLDVGIDKDHPELAGGVFDEANFTNVRFLSEYVDPSGVKHEVGSPDNRGEHGTHVASTIRAIAPDARIANIKVLDEEATFPKGYEGFKHDRATVIASIRKGLDHVLEYNADIKAGRRAGDPIRVVSMSLGLPGSNTEFLSDAERDDISASVKRLADAGVIVVVAAGNEGTGTARRPGNDPSALSVGAVDFANRPTSFSSNKRAIDVESRTTYDIPSVYSYGLDIWAAKYDESGKYAGQTTADQNQFMSGTSMATPHVAGVVALLLSAADANGITLTPAAVKQLLIDSSKPVVGANPYARGGGGTVDPDAAIALMLKRYKGVKPAGTRNNGR